MLRTISFILLATASMLMSNCKTAAPATELAATNSRDHVVTCEDPDPSLHRNFTTVKMTLKASRDAQNPIGAIIIERTTLNDPKLFTYQVPVFASYQFEDLRVPLYVFDVGAPDYEGNVGRVTINRENNNVVVYDTSMHWGSAASGNNCQVESVTKKFLDSLVSRDSFAPRPKR